MGTQVRTCPRCFQLMWIKEDQFEILDEDTFRARCPQCGAASRFKLITEGANSYGPKMGH